MSFRLDDFANFSGTPLLDKLLAAIGFGSAAGISLASVNTALSIMVAVATLAMIIPRAIMNWREKRQQDEDLKFCDQRRARRKHSQS